MLDCESWCNTSDDDDDKSTTIYFDYNFQIMKNELSSFVWMLQCVDDNWSIYCTSKLPKVDQYSGIWLKLLPTLIRYVVGAEEWILMIYCDYTCDTDDDTDKSQ